MSDAWEELLIYESIDMISRFYLRFYDDEVTFYLEDSTRNLAIIFHTIL